MPHFFIDDSYISDDTVLIRRSLHKELYHHIKNVLRMRVGESIFFKTRGRHRYKTILTLVDREKLVFKILSREDYGSSRNYRIFLFTSIPKGDRWNVLLEKTTEIGVDVIVPVLYERSIVRPKVVKERWIRIIQSAAYQSEREHIPKILAPREFDNAIDMCKSKKRMCIFFDRRVRSRIQDFLSLYSKYSSFCFFIGPEGGFSDIEMELLNKNCFGVSLSEFNLRVETAAILSIGIFNFYLNKTSYS